jgi:hypothetical protein
MTSTNGDLDFYEPSRWARRALRLGFAFRRLDFGCPQLVGPLHDNEILFLLLVTKAKLEMDNSTPKHAELTFDDSVSKPQFTQRLEERRYVKKQLTLA